MTTLRARQEAFLLAIREEDAPLPPGWGERQRAGLEIYRNNYRSALVEALRAGFERTERLVGEDSFRQAAVHHCIAHPPSSWTLDLAGEGFAQTCADLFREDPDVGQLAALEWAMGQAFTARDAASLAIEDFARATAGFTEAQWAGLRLLFVPGLAVLETDYDLACLWPSLGEGGVPQSPVALAQRHAVIVWRESERPVFGLRSRTEGEALAALRQGASFGEACALIVAALGETDGAAEAGAMLARWLHEGLVSGLDQ